MENLPVIEKSFHALPSQINLHTRTASLAWFNPAVGRVLGISE